MRLKNTIGIVMVLVLIISSAFVKPFNTPIKVNKDNDPPFLKVPTNWADSVFSTLTPD